MCLWTPPQSSDSVGLGGDQDFSFLTSFSLMLMLLVQDHAVGTTDLIQNQLGDSAPPLEAAFHNG